MQTSPAHLHLNHLAILVSAIIQWLIGAIWYSPLLFAKPWAAMVGLDMGKKPKGMVYGMIASFVGSLVLSFVLAHWIKYAGATGYFVGALIGFLNWLGFIAAPQVAQTIYEQRPFKLYVINTGFWLVALMISGGLLAVWQ